MKISRTLAIHGLTNASGRAKNVSPVFGARRDSDDRLVTSAGHFFLPAACLAATAAFFFWLALLALACFCEDFFWFDFGDLSPITLIFFCGLIHLRHVSFSEGGIIMCSKAVIVNDGHKIPAKMVIRLCECAKANPT